MACISREKAYEVLGLVGEDEKTEVEIKTAYRQRSLATHPDKNANDPEATARFQEVGAAYMRLTREDSDSDDEKGDDDSSDDDSSDVPHQYRHHHHHGFGFPGGMSQDDFLDMFSCFFCVGGFEGSGEVGKRGRSSGMFSSGPIRGGVSGGGNGVYGPMLSSSGWKRAEEAGKWGKGLYRDKSDSENKGKEDDDGSECDAPSGEASSATSFHEKQEAMRKDKQEARAARLEANQAAEEKRLKKQRNDDEIFLKLQEERVKKRREKLVQRETERIAVQAKARVEHKTAQNQKQERAEKKAASKKEDRKRRKAEVDIRIEEAEAFRARAFDCCRAGDLASLRLILDSSAENTGGPPIKLSDRQGARGKTGATMLHMCLTKSGERQALGDDVLKGRLDVATYLVHGVVEKHGRGERDRVNFSKVDSQGLAVLHRAAGEGDTNLLALLLQERARSPALKLEADLDATCLEKGWTPLMHASCGCHLDSVNALLEAGARVNQLSNPTISAVPQQTALAFCKSALAISPSPPPPPPPSLPPPQSSSSSPPPSSVVEPTSRDALKEIVQVLSAAVDKAEGAKREKEEGRRRKQKEEKRKTRENNGKESLEHQLLEKKREQRLEKQKKKEQEEAEAIQKKKTEECERKALARVRREKKKEKREKEQEEAKERALLKEQEDFRMEFYRYGNSCGSKNSPTARGFSDDAEEWETWETVMPEKISALERDEEERKQRIREKLEQKTARGVKTLTSLKRYQQALQSQGYVPSDEGEINDDSAAATIATARCPSRQPRANFSNTTTARSSPPHSPPLPAMPISTTTSTTSNVKAPAHGSTPSHRSTPYLAAGASAFQSSNSNYSGNDSCSGNNNNGIGNRGGNNCGRNGDRNNRSSTTGNNGNSFNGNGESGAGAGGGKGTRSPQSPTKGQARSVAAGGWGESATIVDGVNRWGLEGHPDGEDIDMKSVITLRSRKDSWVQLPSNGTSTVANDSWNSNAQVAVPATNRKGKSEPRSEAGGCDGEGGGRGGNEVAKGAGMAAGVAPAPGAPRVRAGLSSSSSPGSVDWEARAERSRLNEMASAMARSTGGEGDSAGAGESGGGICSEKQATAVAAGGHGAHQALYHLQLQQQQQQQQQHQQQQQQQHQQLQHQQLQLQLQLQHQRAAAATSGVVPTQQQRGRQITHQPQLSQYQSTQQQPLSSQRQPRPPPPPQQPPPLQRQSPPPSCPPPLPQPQQPYPSGPSSAAAAAAGVQPAAGLLTSASSYRPPMLPSSAAAAAAQQLPTSSPGIGGIGPVGVDVRALEAQMTQGVFKEGFPGVLSPPGLPPPQQGGQQDYPLDSLHNQPWANLQVQAIINAGLIRGMMMAPPAGASQQVLLCRLCSNMDPSLFLDAGQGYARCHGVFANGTLCKGIMPWPAGALPEFKPDLPQSQQHQPLDLWQTQQLTSSPVYANSPYSGGSPYPSVTASDGTSQQGYLAGKLNPNPATSNPAYSFHVLGNDGGGRLPNGVSGGGGGGMAGYSSGMMPPSITPAAVAAAIPGGAGFNPALPSAVPVFNATPSPGTADVTRGGGCTATTNGHFPLQKKAIAAGYLSAPHTSGMVMLPRAPVYQLPERGEAPHQHQPSAAPTSPQPPPSAPPPSVINSHSLAAGSGSATTSFMSQGPPSSNWGAANATLAPSHQRQGNTSASGWRGETTTTAQQPPPPSMPPPRPGGNAPLPTGDGVAPTRAVDTSATPSAALSGNGCGDTTAPAAATSAAATRPPPPAAPPAAAGWGEPDASTSSSESAWGQQPQGTSRMQQHNQNGSAKCAVVPSTARPEAPSGWSETDTSSGAAEKSSSVTPSSGWDGTPAPTRPQPGVASLAEAKTLASGSGWGSADGNSSTYNPNAAGGDSSGWRNTDENDKSRAAGSRWKVTDGHNANGTGHGNISCSVGAPSGWGESGGGGASDSAAPVASSGWGDTRAAKPSAFSAARAAPAAAAVPRRPKSRPWGDAIAAAVDPKKLKPAISVAVPGNLRGPLPAASVVGDRRGMQRKKAPAALSLEKRDELHATLVDMGFAVKDCERAFKEVGYEMDTVLNWFFENCEDASTQQHEPGPAPG